MTTTDLAATQAPDETACLAHPDGTRRRTLLTGIAVAAGAVCAGCSSSKSSGASASGSPSSAGGGTSSAASSASSASSSDTSSAASSTSASGSGSSSGSGSAALAATSDVPVGGGTILRTQKIVVTQPTAGTFKAFSAVCTHQGCLVASVAGGLIVCPCHGSQYHIADGSVANGPATQALSAVSITVANGEITQA